MTLAAVCPPATATLSCSHPGCNYTTDRVNNMTRHQRTHSGHSENGPAHWALQLGLWVTPSCCPSQSHSSAPTRAARTAAPTAGRCAATSAGTPERSR